MTARVTGWRFLLVAWTSVSVQAAVSLWKVAGESCFSYFIGIPRCVLLSWIVLSSAKHPVYSFAQNNFLSPNCKQCLIIKYIKMNIFISLECYISSWPFMIITLLIFIFLWVVFCFSMLWHQDGSLQLLPCRFWWAICWEMQAAHISLGL